MNAFTGGHSDPTPTFFGRASAGILPRRANPDAGVDSSVTVLADSTQRWNAPDGTPLMLRPLSERDAPALGALFASLSPDDRRRRFQGAVNALPQDWLHRLAGVDQCHHVGFAVTPAGSWAGPLIAEARWAFDDGDTAAEIALSVAPTWRRRGIGERCLQALLRSAMRHRLNWLYGSVLAENAPMLALARRCGFHCSPSRVDASLFDIELRLDVRPQARRAEALPAAAQAAGRVDPRAATITSC